MTKPLSSLAEQKSPASLFRQYKEKSISTVKNVSSESVKDMLTPYFSIPTASRVQSCFHSQISQKSKSSPSIGRFFSFCFQGVSRALDKLIYQPPPYDTSDIAVPKKLQVPQLPDPVFITHEPQRLFFILPNGTCNEEYCPPCLLIETPLNPLQNMSKEKEILEFVKRSFPSQGILQRDPMGSLYLYIGSNEELLPRLTTELFDISGQKCSSHPLGIHVPVILPEEAMRSKDLGIQDEIGKQHSFSVTGCFEVETPLDDVVERTWFLQVESKELTELREKYLLPSKIAGHSFHIVLFLQKREEVQSIKPMTFRLNVSCYAA